MRTFWIIWCCFWAFFWMILGFITFGLAWIMVPLSLFAILVPIGHDREAMPYGPFYGRREMHQPPPSSLYDPRYSDAEKTAYFKEQERG